MVTKMIRYGYAGASPIHHHHQITGWRRRGGGDAKSLIFIGLNRHQAKNVTARQKTNVYAGFCVTTTPIYKYIPQCLRHWGLFIFSHVASVATAHKNLRAPTVPRSRFFQTHNRLLQEARP